MHGPARNASCRRRSRRPFGQADFVGTRPQPAPDRARSHAVVHHEQFRLAGRLYRRAVRRRRSHLSVRLADHGEPRFHGPGEGAYAGRCRQAQPAAGVGRPRAGQAHFNSMLAAGDHQRHSGTERGHSRHWIADRRVRHGCKRAVAAGRWLRKSGLATSGSTGCRSM